MAAEIRSAQSIEELASIVDNLNQDSITDSVTRDVQETLTNLAEQRLYTIKNETDSKIMALNLPELESFIKTECNNLQSDIKTVITDDYALLNRVNSRADEIISTAAGNLQRMIQQAASAQSIAALAQFGAAKNSELAAAVSESLKRLADVRLNQFQQDIDSLINNKKFDEADSRIQSEGQQLLRDITSVRGDGALLDKVRNMTALLTQKLKQARPGAAGKFFTWIIILAIIIGGAAAYDYYYNDGKIIQIAMNYIDLAKNYIEGLTKK